MHRGSTADKSCIDVRGTIELNVKGGGQAAEDAEAEVLTFFSKCDALTRNDLFVHQSDERSGRAKVCFI